MGCVRLGSVSSDPGSFEVSGVSVRHIRGPPNCRHYTGVRFPLPSTGLCNGLCLLHVFGYMRLRSTGSPVGHLLRWLNVQSGHCKLLNKTRAVLHWEGQPRRSGGQQCLCGGKLANLSSVPDLWGDSTSWWSVEVKTGGGCVVRKGVSLV